MIGSIIGGIFGAKSANKQAKMLANQKKENEDWFNRRYNEDGTQRADAQAALTKMKDAMRESAQNTAGANAVMGGSNEKAAVEKQAQNNALGQTISNITVNAEGRKDNIEGQYQSRRNELENKEIQTEKDKAASMAQMGAGIDTTLNKAMSMFSPASAITGGGK